VAILLSPDQRPRLTADQRPDRRTSDRISSEWRPAHRRSGDRITSDQRPQQPGEWIRKRLSDAL